MIDIIQNSKKYTLVPVLLSLVLLLPVFCPNAHAAIRDLVRFGSDLLIEEDMSVRDAVVIAGDVTVDGVVDRDVVAIGGSIILTENAFVGRNVVAISGKIERSPGANVGGTLTEANIPGLYTLIHTFSGGDWSGPFLIFSVWPLISFLGFLTLALLIAAFFPGTMEAASATIEEHPIGSVFAGFAGMLLIIPLGILLAISIIGLVLIPVEIIIVSTALLFGYVAIAQLIGKKIIMSMKRARTAPIWETLSGMAVLGIIGFIPILGWFLNSLAILFGFGGIWIAILSRRSQRST
jgi:hypothetical protein